MEVFAVEEAVIIAATASSSNTAYTLCTSPSCKVFATKTGNLLWVESLLPSFVIEALMLRL